VVTSPAVGCIFCKYVPQKQCWKKTCKAADMARRCPRVKVLITRSEGSEKSGTRIMLPVHLQQGRSAQLSCSSFQRQKGRDFRGRGGVSYGMQVDCASAQISARLKSLLWRPGHLHANKQGSDHVGFLLSLTGRGRMVTEMSG